MDDALHHWNWSGTGTRVLALHGWGGSGLDFESIASASTHPWKAIDLLGHGLSPRANAPESFFLESQVAKVWERMGEGEFLLGYSMGGRLALHAAIGAPVQPRGLILVGSHPGLKPGPEKEARRLWDHSQADALEARGVPEHMRQWQAEPLIATQAEHVPASAYQYMMNRRREADEESLAASLRGFGAGTMPDCWESLAQVTCPVLLVTGSLDTRYRSLSEAMQGALPAADLLTIPNAGHAAHLENTPDFLDGLHHWMAGR